MSDELKPCPFCGSEAEFRLAATANGLLHRVTCPACGLGQTTYVNKDRAAGKWNSRAAVKERGEDTPTLRDCLDEINNALNYWYPLKPECDEAECDARHVRLFSFRDRLAASLRAQSGDKS